ncbi:hypothetical protein BK139_14725 [Paenibacillus sp. FSL R5-0490]|uniref:hypothetical protein n=1 Tax=Paenibacillus sp. FSL R5-0490 TaxID=1920424 RepID=UPI00096E92B0|nr:hypothetical protein [Paenibacillus sp. FSL R5-0490]OMF56549.1 hypothetical protein BK139_14725 [Paenibacillus sp. FSL R5-0490]
MNRKEKYRRIRISKRVDLSKYSLLGISISSLFLFSLFIMSFGTYAYFNAQYKNEFNIRNATKEELVQITKGPVEYEDKCKAKQTVTVKNIFDYKVVISIDNSEYILQPGETITHTQILADGCGEFGDKSFNIIGYENYFVHPVHVYVEKELLNPKPPCPPQSDNGQGKPNNNGEGKQCGHTDTTGGTTDTELTDSNESEKDDTQVESVQNNENQQESEQGTKEKQSNESIDNSSEKPVTETDSKSEEKQVTTQGEQTEPQQEEQPQQEVIPVKSEESKKQTESSSTEESVS